MTSSADFRTRANGAASADLNILTDFRPRPNPYAGTHRNAGWNFRLDRCRAMDTWSDTGCRR